jgi:phosphoglycerate dehydrogenase-like enzyme
MGYVVGHIWRAGFPPAPRLRLLQSVAAGLDLLDTAAVPKGVTICNVFGHEPAIAEYVIMTMLVLTHRLFEAVTAFRAGSWGASPQFGGGSPHGEVLGRTIGIIVYGRIGREVAERAAGLKCRVLAANRSPVADPAPAETVFPLAELDRMLPLCDTLLIACALAPETKGLIDSRRLALMKPGALLINVARARIVDEDALYAALKDGHLGGAALDVWWQYPTPAEPERRPSRSVPRIAECVDHAAQFEQHRSDRRPALERGGRQSRPLRARRDARKHRASDLTGRPAALKPRPEARAILLVASSTDHSARAHGFGCRSGRAAMARRTLSRLASTMLRSGDPGAVRPSSI